MREGKREEESRRRHRVPPGCSARALGAAEVTAGPSRRLADFGVGCAIRRVAGRRSRTCRAARPAARHSGRTPTS